MRGFGAQLSQVCAAGCGVARQVDAALCLSGCASGCGHSGVGEAQLSLVCATGCVYEGVGLQ